MFVVSRLSVAEPSFRTIRDAGAEGSVLGLKSIRFIPAGKLLSSASFLTVTIDKTLCVRFHSVVSVELGGDEITDEFCPSTPPPVHNCQRGTGDLQYQDVLTGSMHTWVVAAQSRNQVELAGKRPATRW